MFFSILLALVMGVLWVNLLVYGLFKTRFIYKYITVKGQLRIPFEEGGRRWLVVLGLVYVAYLTVCDLLILGYNDYSFPIILLLNLMITGLLLAYNAFVINGWLLTIQRPMMLNISKLMTPITIRSYTRFTLIQGGVSGFVLSMVSGWLYLMINSMAR